MSSSSGDEHREAHRQEQGCALWAAGWDAAGSSRCLRLATGDDQHCSPTLPTLRCELSVEKSTVLQSELESCKELQELEPENKCEARFP